VATMTIGMIIRLALLPFVKVVFRNFTVIGIGIFALIIGIGIFALIAMVWPAAAQDSTRIPRVVSKWDPVAKDISAAANGLYFFSTMERARSGPDNADIVCGRVRPYDFREGKEQSFVYFVARKELRLANDDARTVVDYCAGYLAGRGVE